MPLSNEQTELLSIIKAILHNEHPRISSDINYNRLYEIAKRNSVANSIASVIEEQNDAKEEIKQKFQKQRLAIILQQDRIDNALHYLYDALDKKEIRGIFLKGTLLRSLYPQHYIRSMSDIDVYTEEANMDALSSIMLGLGYSPGTIGIGNHYEYTISKMVKVEFHPELVALDSDYGRSVFQRIHPEAHSVADHMDIWAHTIPIEGHEYARQLTTEYHYVYVIMHMMNHFLTAGTGIRSIMDIWVMNHQYMGIWNRSQIETLLDEFGLKTFEKYARWLADKWFDLSEVDYFPQEIDAKSAALFEEYILESGTYGTTEHSVSRQMGHQTGVMEKFYYYLIRFFLPYRQMKELYPVLRKTPILLPLLWPYRVVEMFTKRRKNAIYKFLTVATASKSAADKHKELFDAIIG